MNFEIEWLHFTVLEASEDDASVKQIRMQKLLTGDEYRSSELRSFLDGEFTRIAKRKVETNPKSESSPTKIGQFVIVEGHSLDSNPNFAQFMQLLNATTSDAVNQHCREMLQSYLRTPQVRGGVLLIVKTRLERFDDHFLFLLKCDFEQKTAVITDEKSLINNVQMAINAKNMKSIMFPLLLEEGMVDSYHVKIHQFSHARYFEEFLKYIDYPQTVMEIVSQEVISLARQHIEMIHPEETDERRQAEEAIELMAASPKRELAERWDHETVLEAAQIITDQQPEVELKFKLDHIQVRSLLADYGVRVHIGKVNGSYVVVLEGETLTFEKGMSPVEFLKPKELEDILHELKRPRQQHDDTPPW
ncbi:DUF3900 domain-containing protein [Brevibacillus fluminis]|uniref:DUF3900 domain-containing protein n=1 Tax=Brevibacillus fluminis TaxID=511487 RepID=UPI003F88F4AC